MLVETRAASAATADAERAERIDSDGDRIIHTLRSGNDDDVPIEDEEAELERLRAEHRRLQNRLELAELRRRSSHKPPYPNIAPRLVDILYPF